MKNKFILGVSLLLALPCQAQDHLADGEKLVACRYSNKKPMTSGEAKLVLRDGKIHQIGFNNYYPGGLGEFGYICHIELNRGDGAYSWQDNGPDLVLTARETGDRIQLSRSKKGYTLSFAGLKSQSRYCGDGAQLPDNLLIPFSGKSCTASIPR